MIRSMHQEEFEPMSLVEMGRLALIVVSSALIATAGFVSHADTDSESPRATTSSVVVGKNATTEEKFARSQIKNFERVLADLTERAELESDPRTIERMKSVLANLDDQLQTTRHQLIRLQRQAAISEESPSGRDQNHSFAKEDLRASLLVLQDAGAKAIATFMEADARTGVSASPAAIATKKKWPEQQVTRASFTFSESNAPGSDRNP